MFNCLVYYPLADKDLIEQAIAQLNEQGFDCWLYPPRVFLGEPVFEVDEDGEIPVCLEYENKADKKHECIHGHDAMDLVQAFVAGVLWYSKTVKETNNENR